MTQRTYAERVKLEVKIAEHEHEIAVLNEAIGRLSLRVEELEQMAKRVAVMMQVDSGGRKKR